MNATSDAYTLRDFFAAQTVHISIPIFLLNLVLAAVLGWLLGRVYTRFGTSFSNRKQFANNFVILSMTTMVIITIVKSSLALSLGLVGALSIIRFRAAIREPEELTFLFLAISIGLGLGAERTVLTLIAFAVIMFVIGARHLVRGGGPKPNLYLTVSGRPEKVDLPRVLEVLESSTAAVAVKRFDQTPDLTEASFAVQFDSSAQLDACTRRLRALDEQVRVSFIEQSGLGA
jgi:hypothetical protein